MSGRDSSSVTLEVRNVPHYVSQDEFSRLFLSLQGCQSAVIRYVGNTAVGFVTCSNYGFAAMARQAYNGWQGWGSGPLTVEIFHDHPPPASGQPRESGFGIRSGKREVVPFESPSPGDHGPGPQKQQRFGYVNNHGRTVEDYRGPGAYSVGTAVPGLGSAQRGTQPAPQPQQFNPPQGVPVAMQGRDSQENRMGLAVQGGRRAGGGYLVDEQRMDPGPAPSCTGGAGDGLPMNPGFASLGRNSTYQQVGDGPIPANIPELGLGIFMGRGVGNMQGNGILFDPSNVPGQSSLNPIFSPRNAAVHESGNFRELHSMPHQPNALAPVGNTQGIAPPNMSTDPRARLATPSQMGISGIAGHGPVAIHGQFSNDMNASVDPVGPDPYVPEPRNTRTNGATAVAGQVTELAGSTLYVEGLPPDVSKREVAHIFRPFEGFQTVRLIRKEKNNSCIVLGFVEFASEADASVAMNTLQGYPMDLESNQANLLHLSYARSKPKPVSSNVDRHNNQRLVRGGRTGNKSREMDGRGGRGRGAGLHPLDLKQSGIFSHSGDHAGQPRRPQFQRQR